MFDKMCFFLKKLMFCQKLFARTRERISVRRTPNLCNCPFASKECAAWAMKTKGTAENKIVRTANDIIVEVLSTGPTFNNSSWIYQQLNLVLRDNLREIESNFWKKVSFKMGKIFAQNLKKFANLGLKMVQTKIKNYTDSHIHDQIIFKHLIMKWLKFSIKIEEIYAIMYWLKIRSTKFWFRRKK